VNDLVSHPQSSEMERFDTWQAMSLPMSGLYVITLLSCTVSKALLLSQSISQSKFIFILFCLVAVW